MQKLLHAIENENHKYGMKLNKKKCELLTFGTSKQITFLNGEKVICNEEVKYLGCHINETIDIKQELNKRLETISPDAEEQRFHYFPDEEPEHQRWTDPYTESEVLDAIRDVGEEALSRRIRHAKNNDKGISNDLMKLITHRGEALIQGDVDTVKEADQEIKRQKK